jgi:chromosomal replication initiator protein
MHEIDPVKAPLSRFPADVPHAPMPAAMPAQSLPMSPEWAWERLQEGLKTRVQPEQFEAWFRRAALVEAGEHLVRLAVQNNFAREWLENYYREKIEAAAREVFGGTRRIEITVAPELCLTRGAEAVAAQATSPSQASHPHNDLLNSRDTADHDAGPMAPPGDLNPAPRGSSNSSSASNNTRNAGAQRAHGASSRGASSARPNTPNTYGLLWNSDIGLNPKYTFDNFVVGPCNRFAHAAAVGAAEAPGKSYNPFFLHGSVGLGKTHLLQSLCFSLLERNPKTRILYLSCETFVNHFISALENGDLQKFRNKYRGVDVLVVDDIHVLANKDRTQEEFFHTFNTLYQSGKQIVLSSDSPPKDIPTLQERLVSRFKWGLVTEIEPPCYETRMAILKRKSREKGREIPDDVACLLAQRIDSNIRELEGAVTKLIGFAGVSCLPVSCDLAREALRDIFEVRKGQPSMEDILALVCDHFDVKISELQSKKRTNAIAYPRQIAMYLARQITRHSLEEIGGFFGGRDHSTVIYAVEKVGLLMVEDGEAREVVEGFLARLQGPGS